MRPAFTERLEHSCSRPDRSRFSGVKQSTERHNLDTESPGSAGADMYRSTSDCFEPGERGVLVNALSGSSFVHLLLVLPLFLYGELVVSQQDLSRAEVRTAKPLPASQFVFSPSALATAQSKQPDPVLPIESVADIKTDPPKADKPKSLRPKATKMRKSKAKMSQRKRQRQDVAAVAPPTNTSKGSVAAVVESSVAEAPAGPATSTVNVAPEPTATASGVASSFDRKGALRDYIRLLSSAVKKRYKYPRAARRAGIEGRVVVKLVLDDQGRVLQVELMTSSGHEILDNAALEAARSVKVLPPAPSALEWGKKAIRVPFNFRQTS